MTSLARQTEDPSTVDMPPVPLRRLDEHRPFTLLSYPLLLGAGTRLLGSGDLMDTASKPFVEIGPSDAGRLRIANGDRVRVSSACGAVEGPARVSTRVADRCVFVPANLVGMRGMDLLDVGEPVTLVRVEKL
jgi:anaerobic selenocysteine-containing dehydrogenase